MNQVGTYNNQDFRIARVFFTGTATLAEGQSLCWQEQPATSASTKGFPFDVELPNSDNLRVFAGIVAESSIGKTGPAYIDIVIPRPGDILKVLVTAQAGDLTKGNLLSLNNDVATNTDISLAAFSLAALSSTATLAVPATDATTLTITNSVAAFSAIQPLVRALESLASITLDGNRRLLWVQFQ